MANTWGDWLKRYWVWILVGVALLCVMFAALFPTGDKGALKILKDAEDKAKKLKDEKEQELAEITKEMDARVDELMEIKAIEDEDERLKRLAEFANRRSG